jgi:DNA-binding NtrC family response regulator
MQLRDRIEILVEEMLDGQILLNEAMSEFEKIYIEKALKRNKEHLSNTSEVLGIHRNTLSKRVSHYKNNHSKTPTRLLKTRAR